MRHSLSLLWKTLLLSTASSVMLSACGANTPTKTTPDPYDRYYGQATSTQDTTFTPDIVVNPAAPQTYVVQKGDTLWSIAQKFLSTPWYWPEVWDHNQTIHNPHLLYPGDILTLDYAGNAGDKLMPQIRVDRRGEGEPIATLTPFLLYPRVLDEATLNTAPYILASRDDHHLISNGETLYVKNLRGAQQGNRFAFFHPNGELRDPKTGQVLGHEVTYSGYGRVERIDDPATMKVLETVREIRAGDRVLAPIDEMANLGATIHAPTTKVRADIVKLFDAEVYSGDYMIVVINKGARDRMEIGHTLGIYAQGKTITDPNQHYTAPHSGMTKPINTQLPPEKVADLVLYKVENNVSYGLIMNNAREVKSHYQIGNP